MFEDQYHPAVKKDLKKIDIQTRKEIQDEWLPILLQYPYQGQVLAGPLQGLRSFHLKVKTIDYRIAYSIDESEKIIEILMIAKRESFYDILKKRII